jgi:hypothetical protein
MLSAHRRRSDIASFIAMPGSTAGETVFNRSL